MAKNNCELFGVFLYSQDLSYDDLYDVEQDLSVKLQEILEDNGAVHLDFWGTGDAMRLQCAFPDFDEDLLQSICDEVASLITDKVEGRMLAVEKQLTSACAYYFAPGQWKEEVFDLAGDYFMS